MMSYKSLWNTCFWLVNHNNVHEKPNIFVLFLLFRSSNSFFHTNLNKPYAELLYIYIYIRHGNDVILVSPQHQNRVFTWPYCKRGSTKNASYLLTYSNLCYFLMTFICFCFSSFFLPLLFVCCVTNTYKIFFYYWNSLKLYLEEILSWNCVDLLLFCCFMQMYLFC